MSSKQPILFKDEMIRAILEGRKTQTRRVVKGIDHDLLDMMSEDIVSGAPNSELLELIYGPSTDDDGKHVPDQWLVRCTECPEEGVLTMGQGYGKPGDRLWIRETWRQFNATDECGCSDAPCSCPSTGAVLYRASHDDGESKWKAAIHMPRWAGRITLEITDVRVERLQDISQRDAQAEGCEKPNLPPEVRGVAADFIADERTSFAILWNRINGAGAWDANPWVWAIEFKRVDQEAGAV